MKWVLMVCFAMTHCLGVGNEVSETGDSVKREESKEIVGNSLWPYTETVGNSLWPYTGDNYQSYAQQTGYIG